MEGRPSRGRGTGGKRGGSDRFGGEHRGRGRGGHHRGRGRRDHQRGRGRVAVSGAAELHQPDHDGRTDPFEDDDMMEVYSRRSLGSNWDRYEESEKAEPADDSPTQRGSDFQVLLESAGDSFTQFRFAEEKHWQKDSFAASQMSLFVDLPALAQTLQQLPLHHRLNLEAELLQVSAPVDLPALALAPKQEMAPKKVTAVKQLLPNIESQVSQRTADLLLEDADEELDRLLSLEKPLSSDSSVVVEPCSEVEAGSRQVEEGKKEEPGDQHVTSPKSACVRQEMTEEDLEDWLDSMIS